MIKTMHNANATPPNNPPHNLADKLARHITEHGPVSIETFMQFCLTDPGYGYYKNQNPIGSSGDFITAPETSQIFGELIGLWVADVWQHMGQPKGTILCEAGPGRGTLLADALRALNSVKAPAIKDFSAKLNVHLVETSPLLQQMQKTCLAELPQDCYWHSTLETLPSKPTILIANEFFDALPIRQFEHKDGHWYERVIDIVDKNGERDRKKDASEDEDGPFFCIRCTDTAADNATSLLKGYDLNQAGNGAIAELHPAEKSIIQMIAKRGEKHPFILLLIDYGHSHTAFGDTLQAVKNHTFSHPLEQLGQSDLTAHVDFARLKKLAQDNGLSCYGPMPQGQFLLRLGLEVRLQTLLQKGSAEQKDLLVSGAARLVDPNQMGILFKVMVISTHDLPSLPPFDIKNETKACHN